MKGFAHIMGAQPERLLLAATAITRMLRIPRMLQPVADAGPWAATLPPMAVCLRNAILNKTLSLAYQAIFDTNGTIQTVESLARWHDPIRGEVSPCEFVGVAERYGMIADLTSWCLRTACEQQVAWIRIGVAPQRIAVNISPIAARGDDFVEKVIATLSETGLAANRLELEITETAFTGMEEICVVSERLQKLRSMGTTISIDDFGNGHSSLCRIQQIEADVLKIDRSFMQAMEQKRGCTAVLRAILTMAASLKMRVIAEGVETLSQLEVLHELHCDAVQGYFLARPMSTDQMMALLQSQRGSMAA